MKFDLIKLKNKIVDSIVVDFKYSFSDEQLVNTEILKFDDLSINGEFYLNAIDEVFINLSINGIMILPCAITLKPVPYEIDVQIEGGLAEFIEEIDENIKNDENTIDIFPIIWENILMEIPMRVVSEDSSNIELKGDGWKLVSDTSKEEVEINPELEKLKDLL